MLDTSVTPTHYSCYSRFLLAVIPAKAGNYRNIRRFRKIRGWYQKFPARGRDDDGCGLPSINVIPAHHFCHPHFLLIVIPAKAGNYRNTRRRMKICGLYRKFPAQGRDDDRCGLPSINAILAHHIRHPRFLLIVIPAKAGNYGNTRRRRKIRGLYQKFPARGRDDDRCRLPQHNRHSRFLLMSSPPTTSFIPAKAGN